MKWDEMSIAVCRYHSESFMPISQFSLGFFYRASIPTDINQHAPDPTNWGVPSAQLSSTGCSLSNFFIQHQIVFGTSFVVVSYNLQSVYYFSLRYYNMRFVQGVPFIIN
jgi:hypothetical protein